MKEKTNDQQMSIMRNYPQRNLKKIYSKKTQMVAVNQATKA